MARYVCGSEGRRQAVAASSSRNGIDFLEVSQDQTTLEVHFLHPLPGAPNSVPPAPAPELEPINVVVSGGVRISSVGVEDVSTVGSVLQVNVDRPGDFSTYTFKLRRSLTDDSVPEGFDERLSEISFSFKAACPTDLDCRRDAACFPRALEEPEIDYRAKDFESFRRLMLDRIAALSPDVTEDNVADLGTMLVELLAYAGDHLSYHQDAIATEAYLGTARRRTSVRRHARLLDYRVSEGCNARAWVHIETALPALTVPESTMLLSGSPASPVVDPDELAVELTAEPVVFETMHSIVARASHNEIAIHTWSDDDCCLPTGSTNATLVDEPPLQLQSGDYLLFEEVRGAATGNEGEAEREHRHVVRITTVEAGRDEIEGVDVVEVGWAPADALPFPLCASAVVEQDGVADNIAIAVARGNIVLADHGLSLPHDPATAGEALVGDGVPLGSRYRPRLQRGPLTYGVPFDPVAPAVLAAAQSPRLAGPLVELTNETARWKPVDDLLASDRFAHEFVVEMESDGFAYLRFGDDVNGRAPRSGSEFVARYRVGSGTAGNVGADTLVRIALEGGGVDAVRNPLPARGGTDPEPNELVRRMAPLAFKKQERAVTAEDYARVAQRHEEVQSANAEFRWTGSWYTVFVAVDRLGGRRIDRAFKNALNSHLERYRLAGFDVEIQEPLFAPLEIVLDVCVHERVFASDVKAALLEVFGSGTTASGSPGFFHPDNFTFGRPLYLSQIYAVAMEVPGVADVAVTTFKRWGRKAEGELEMSELVPSAREILRLDNDPDALENGTLEAIVRGGL